MPSQESPFSLWIIDSYPMVKHFEEESQHILTVAKVGKKKKRKKEKKRKKNNNNKNNNNNSNAPAIKFG